MTWNYRVMRHDDASGGEPYLRVHKVFTDEDGKIGWSEGEATPLGETIAELRQHAEWIALALDKPILSYATGKEVGIEAAEGAP